VCSGCGTTQHLSHSHLIPRSYRKDLEAVKENITFHCLSVGKKGCHEHFEGMGAPLLMDFQSNMEIIRRLDETYFLKKLFKLHQYWNVNDRSNSFSSFVAKKALSPFLSELPKINTVKLNS